MKQYFIFGLTLVFHCTLVAQSHPQLRLRFGAAKSIVSAGKSQENTFFRMYDKRSPLPSGIGLEFAKPIKKQNNSLLLGAFLDVQPYSISINPKKFAIPPGGGVGSSGNGSIRFYAGLEKRIGKKQMLPSKSIISFFGGLGISYNFPGAGPGSWWGGGISDGLTTSGKVFQGYYGGQIGFPAFDAYYAKVRSHKAHTFTPDIFGGFRWNIRNKKGNTTMIVELVANYGLMTKFYHDVSYTLDGQPQMDRLKDKGVNVQINVLIPLKNFGKKKKK